MTDEDRAFDYMQAEEVQREDEAAADAYIAELTQDTAPACHLPHLAALAQQRDAPGVVRVRLSNMELPPKRLTYARLSRVMHLK